MRFLAGAVGLGAVVLAGCSGDADPLVGSELLAPPPAGQGTQLRMAATIAPGDEVEYCQYVALTEHVDVARFEHRYSTGSHHLVLYATTLTAEDVANDTAMYECATRPDQKTAGVIYAAQVDGGDLSFPAGVGMPFEPGQVVMLQSHYLNASGAALDADVRLNLWGSTVPVEHEAGNIFFYNYMIAVPAHGSARAEMRCTVPEDITLFSGMSHMHRRGVGYRAALTGGDLAEPLELYATDDWEHVEPRVYEPALAIGAGQAIEFACDFENEGEETIIEGPSAEANEMCMFVGAYWPRIDAAFESCVSVGSGPMHHGEKTCAEALDCASAAADEVAAEECLVDTCEGSSPALGAFSSCTFYECNAECIQGQGGCEGCVAQHCLDHYLACQEATCGG
jgi:hypothetical protein